MIYNMMLTYIHVLYKHSNACVLKYFNIIFSYNNNNIANLYTIMYIATCLLYHVVYSYLYRYNSNIEI